MERKIELLDARARLDEVNDSRKSKGSRDLRSRDLRSQKKFIMKTKHCSVHLFYSTTSLARLLKTGTYHRERSIVVVSLFVRAYCCG